MFYFGLAKVRRFFIFYSMYNKGICKENLGEYPKALHFLFYALSLNRKSLKTYKAIIRVNNKHRYFLNAIDFCNKAQQLFPNNADLYELKADAYRKLKDYDKVISCYDKAIQIDYNNAGYYVKRAQIKYYINDIQGAINDLNGAVLIDKKNSRLYSQRAFYNFIKKNLLSAKNDYTTAINLSPQNSHYYYMRAAVEKLLGQNNEADIDFNMAKKL